MDTFLGELFFGRFGQLSNDDCRMVHFYFGDSIPRRIRDDLASETTWSFMEFLFDQGKINAEDITYLLDRLDEISGAPRGCTLSIRNRPKQALS